MLATEAPVKAVAMSTCTRVACVVQAMALVQWREANNVEAARQYFQQVSASHATAFAPLPLPACTATFCITGSCEADLMYCMAPLPCAGGIC
jgi:hypothetical protein